MVKRWKPVAVLLVTFALAVSLENEFFMFLLGFEAMVIGAAWLQVAWLSHRVHMHIELPERMVYRGEAFQIQAELTNQSSMPLPQLLARAAIRVFPEHEELLMRGKTMLAGRETGRLCFEMNSAHCACLEIRPDQLMITDYLGIAQRRCRVDQTERHLLFVLPECLKQDLELPQGRDALLEEDGDDERRGHTSVDVAEIRVYQPGDPIKLIHWKLSARMEEVLVREMSDPADALIQLYIDLQEQDANANSRADHEAWDRLMETVAGVSAMLLEHDRKHLVFWADATADQLTAHTVSDEESQQTMLCALLRAETYYAKDYVPLMKEVYAGEAQETCIQIDLQGRIDRTKAAR